MTPEHDCSVRVLSLGESYFYLILINLDYECIILLMYAFVFVSVVYLMTNKQMKLRRFVATYLRTRGSFVCHYTRFSSTQPYKLLLRATTRYERKLTCNSIRYSLPN